MERHLQTELAALHKIVKALRDTPQNAVVTHGPAKGMRYHTVADLSPLYDQIGNVLMAIDELIEPNNDHTPCFDYWDCY